MNAESLKLLERIRDSLAESGDADVERLLKTIETEVGGMLKKLKSLSGDVKKAAEKYNKWEDDPNGGRPINRDKVGDALEMLGYALASQGFRIDPKSEIATVRSELKKIKR